MEFTGAFLVITILLSSQLICNVQSEIRSDYRDYRKLPYGVEIPILNELPTINVPNAVVDVPVPVNIDFYEGENQKIDNCARDHIERYGRCERILSRGSCPKGEQVIVDFEKNKGICVPRLCPPDRVFVRATQKCHTPRDEEICPGGRELFSAADGTEICDCPVGTVESSNSLHENVCEPILSESRKCHKGQVVWFNDFRSRPQCFSDPCNGKNSYILPGGLPFVPSQYYGECHQLGQTDGVCPPGLIYALHLPTLRGVCQTLENLGYEQFSQEDLDSFNPTYGISETYGSGTVGSLYQDGHSQQHHQSQTYSREQSHRSNSILSDYRSEYLRSLGFRESGIPAVLVAFVSTSSAGVTPYSHEIRILPTGSEDGRRIEDMRLPENITVSPQIAFAIAPPPVPETAGGGLASFQPQAVTDTLPNIFSTGLIYCSVGFSKDTNVKCNENVGPGRPKRVPVNGRPTPISRPCPPGFVIRTRTGGCVLQQSSNVGELG